jgi:molybdenum cofactor cytidylyltransferase
MKFGPVPINQAQGKILGHNVTGPDGRRLLRKGKPLTAADVVLLRDLGRSSVYVAELETGDVDENSAARRIATAVAGPGVRFSGPATGRVNLVAETVGLLRVDATHLATLNSAEGVTVATLSSHTAVAPGKMVATIKIIPYGLPEAVVRRAEGLADGGTAVVAIDELQPRRVALILSGAPAARERLASFDKALRSRLEALRATIVDVAFVPLEEEEGELELAAQLQAQVASGIDLIILAGETAIMDRYDIAPRAVERAGGDIVAFGAPVDPGNLLMLAYLGQVPILGAPGCARSPKTNVVDVLLPPLLAGDRLRPNDIAALGHGGLFEDVPERPLPRSQVY